MLCFNSQGAIGKVEGDNKEAIGRQEVSVN